MPAAAASHSGDSANESGVHPAYGPIAVRVRAVGNEVRGDAGLQAPVFRVVRVQSSRTGATSSRHSSVWSGFRLTMVCLPAALTMARPSVSFPVK